MKLLATLLLACLVVQAQTYKIAGRVIREGTGNPVRSVRVILSLSQHADQQVSCVTGDSGEFGFTDVPKGKYSLVVDDHGRKQEYLENDGFSTAIVTGPGLDTEHIVFPLQSMGTIVGSVVDEAGDPVRNATVYLFWRSVYLGTAQIGLRETKATGSDGSFHFSRLKPGTYYVGVTGTPWYAQMPTIVQDSSGQHTQMPPPELDVAYPLTYYDGTTSPDGASPIQLDPGSRASIAFHLQPVEALHISLDGAGSDQDMRNMMIVPMLKAIGPGGTLVDVRTSWGGPIPGLTGVAPGSYVLSVLNGAENGKPNVSLGSFAVDWTSDTTMNLNDGGGTSVSGKVVVAGELRDRVAVVLEGIGNSNAAPGWVAHDGTFAIQNISPGRYNVRLANTHDLYMKSVEVKGGTYSNGVLQVNLGSQIELTVRTAAGLQKVEGVATKDAKPFAGATVLMIPQSAIHGNRIPRDQSDSDGSFSLSDVPPGKYTLLAIANSNGLEYTNSTVIAPYLPNGRLIDVPQPANARVQIEVQSLVH